MAILRNYNALGGVTEPQIVLSDRLPPNLATKVALPPGAHVLATLGGSTIQVIGTAPGQPDSIRSWFAGEFDRRGYRPASWGSSRAPFRPAERSLSEAGYCSGEDLFTVSVQPRPVLPNSCSTRTERRASDLWVERVRRQLSSGSNPPLRCSIIPGWLKCRCDAHGTAGPDRTRRPMASSRQVCRPNRSSRTMGGADSAGWKPKRMTTGAAGSWTKRDSTGRDVRLLVSVAERPRRRLPYREHDDDGRPRRSQSASGLRCCDRVRRHANRRTTAQPSVRVRPVPRALVEALVVPQIGMLSMPGRRRARRAWSLVWPWDSRIVCGCRRARQSSAVLRRAAMGRRSCAPVSRTIP